MHLTDTLERIFSRNYHFHFPVFQLQSSKSYTRSWWFCYWGSGSCESLLSWSFKLSIAAPGSAQSLVSCTCILDTHANPFRPCLRLSAGHELWEGDSNIYCTNRNASDNSSRRPLDKTSKLHSFCSQLIESAWSVEETTYMLSTWCFQQYEVWNCWNICNWWEYNWNICKVSELWAQNNNI